MDLVIVTIADKFIAIHTYKNLLNLGKKCQ